MEQEDLSTVITVKLRISPKLRDLIAESAKTNNRSMNADMNFRLEKSFEGGEESSNKLISEIIDMAKLIDKLDQKIDMLNAQLKNKTPD